MLSLLREGVQILSTDWRYLYVNEAAARHGRRRVDELLGRSMVECYPGIEHSEMFATLRRCMSERREETIENEFALGGGEPRSFELHIRPCSRGIVVVSLDITERNRVEGLLRQSEKLNALGQLAASVAHDLKNVFNPIALHARVLRAALPASAVPSLDSIDEAVRTGSETVERLRRFSRQEPDVAPVPIELDRFVDTALALCAPRTDARPDVVLRRELGNPPAVPVRGSELVTAIVNLVMNALDAMPERGTLTVRTGALDGTSWVEVADDGPGMPPEVERRAFEPFFTTKSNGTGLGLAGSYAFVQRHGGRISLDTAPGKGTCVRMAFSDSVIFPQASPPRPLRAARLRLLLVEDEPASRAALKTLLVEEGYDVETAANGDEALARLGAASPDLMLIDWRMPGMDGLTLAARARELQNGIPIVMMTGEDESQPELAALVRSPHTAYVSKPIDLERLLQALQGVRVER